MLKKYLLIALFILLCFFCVVCIIAFFILRQNAIVVGSGNIQTDSRDIKNFKNVDISGNFKITLQESTDEGIEITAEDNLLPKIKTDLSGDTTYIYIEKKFPFLFDDLVQNTKPMEIKIKYKKINSLKISGNNNLTNNSDKLRIDTLNLEINGTAQVQLNIFADQLSLNSNGANQVALTGAVTKQTLTLNGSTSLSSAELESKETTITLNGAGSAVVRADDNLVVTLNGSGRVDYYGNPKKFSQNINGSGQVNKLQ